MAAGIKGDAYNHKKSIRETKINKSRIEAAQQQNISGLKYNKGYELGGKIVFVDSIQRERQLLTGYISQNTAAVKLRLEGEEHALHQIKEEAIRFKESLVLFNDGNSTKDPTSFLVGFKQHLKTIEQAGNTKIGDSYILGGTITNTPPFDVSKIDDGLDPASGVTLDYYLGNNISVLIAIDTNDNLECELKGQHSAFEKLIRALKIASDSSIVSGDERVNKAQELVDEAIVDIAGLLSKVGSKELNLDSLIEAQEDRELYLSEAYNKILESTPEESATIFMKEHTTLEMRFAMMKRMEEMSLAHYLK